jgi:hypothetical protein
MHAHVSLLGSLKSADSAKQKSKFPKFFLFLPAQGFTLTSSLEKTGNFVKFAQVRLIVEAPLCAAGSQPTEAAN